MATYSCKVRAGEISLSGEEEALIDLACPASTTISILRVRVSSGASGSDANIRIRLLEKSAIGTGSIAGVAVRKDPLSPASVVTATINGGTGTTYNVGTITTIIDEMQCNGRATFEWIAPIMPNGIKITAGQIFGINCQVTASSTLFVTVIWRE